MTVLKALFLYLYILYNIFILSFKDYSFTASQPGNEIGKPSYQSIELIDVSTCFFRYLAGLTASRIIIKRFILFAAEGGI